LSPPPPNRLPPSPDAAAFALDATGAVLITGLDDGRLLCALLDQFRPEPWEPYVPRCVVVAQGPWLEAFAATYRPRYPSRLVVVDCDPFEWTPPPRPFDWAWHAAAPDLDGFEELFMRYDACVGRRPGRQGAAGLAALEAEWRPSGLPWWRKVGA